MAGISEDYPIIIDGTTLPFFPTTWTRQPQKIERINQSEGGRDIVQQIRANKMKISASFVIANNTWVKFFEEENLKESFVVKEYSPKLEAYDERTMRMSNYSCGIRRKSQELSNIYGVWEISFDLEEF